MKTKTSILKLSSVGLLFTIQKATVEAATISAVAHSEAQIDAEISSLANSVQQALSLSGLGSEAEADSDIKNLIEEHVQNQLAEEMFIEETQKTNLEESNQVELEQKVSTTKTIRPGNLPSTIIVCPFL
jgi:hypothetical protein